MFYFNYRMKQYFCHPHKYQNVNEDEVKQITQKLKSWCSKLEEWPILFMIMHAIYALLKKTFNKKTKLKSDWRDSWYHKLSVALKLNVLFQDLCTVKLIQKFNFSTKFTVCLHPPSPSQRKRKQSEITLD